MTTGSAELQALKENTWALLEYREVESKQSTIVPLSWAAEIKLRVAEAAGT